MTKPLWKTTIIIWSNYCSDEVEIEDLARDATSGDAYCSKSESVHIPHPSDDPDWVDTEFFYDGSNDWINCLDQGDTVTFTAREETDQAENHTGPLQFIEDVGDDLWHVVFTNGLDIQAHSDELSQPEDEEEDDATLRMD